LSATEVGEKKSFGKSTRPSTNIPEA
jgi:hypothetical protein